MKIAARHLIDAELSAVISTGAVGSALIAPRLMLWANTGRQIADAQNNAVLKSSRQRTYCCGCIPAEHRFGKDHFGSVHSFAFQIIIFAVRSSGA
jgi:hypothetical protein